MKLVSNSTFLLAFIFLMACNNKKTDATTSVGEKGLYEFTDINVKGNDNFSGKLSELFDVKKRIKLEISSREVLKSIDKIVFNSNRIYILNRFDNRAVYVFDMNGKYLYPIGNNRGGIGGYNYSYDLIVDDQVQLLDLGRILSFDKKDGKYVDQREIEYSAIRFYKFANDYFFVRGNNEPYLTLVQNGDFAKGFSYFPNGAPSHLTHPYSSFIEGADNVLFQINYSNQIFNVQKDRLGMMYHINFEDNDINQSEIDKSHSPSEISDNFFYKKIVKEFFIEMRDYYYFVFKYKGREKIVIKSRKNDREYTMDFGEIENNLTDEKYFPWIVTRHDNMLVAVKSLENDEIGLEYDFELVFLEVREDAF